MNDLAVPDFIIGGAPRSGTTWVCNVLDQHEQIYMAKPVQPEPKFFLVDDIYDRGMTFYSSYFKNRTVEAMAGEKSTNYMESPQAAVRIKQHLPDIKLIFILRNPVERAFNNYLWSKKNGYEKEAFEVALALEEKRDKTLSERLRFARPHDYFSRGCYATHLKRYYDLFPRQNILCLFFEDLALHPESFVLNLHRFLGVREKPEDVIHKKINSVGTVSDSFPEHAKKRLEQEYMAHNDNLAELLQKELPW